MESNLLTLPSWFEFRLGAWIARKLTRFVESRTPPDLRLIDMASAYEQAQCLYVAATLKVADHLVDGPKAVESLARELEVQPDPLSRVLRYLHELGVFGRDASGRYALNQVSEFLVTDHPHSQRDIVILSNGEAFTAWGNLLHTVKTGENAFAYTHGVRTFEYHRKNPAFGAVFDRAMVSVSALPDQAIAQDYDFSTYRTLADIGGGRGNLLREIVLRYPALQGILFDTAAVLTEELREQWRQDPLGSRVELQVGDFFESVPADVDAYILKDVVHNWPDDEVIRLYSSIHRTMKQEARLLVAELVIAQDDPLRRVKLNLDVNMLVIHSGQERTAAQHRQLLEKSGFKMTRIVPTRSILSVIEAQHG